MNPAAFRKRKPAIFVDDSQERNSPKSKPSLSPSNAADVDIGLRRSTSEASPSSPSSPLASFGHPQGRALGRPRLPTALPRLKVSKASKLLHNAASAPNLRDLQAGRSFKYLGPAPPHLVTLLRRDSVEASALREDVSIFNASPSSTTRSALHVTKSPAKTPGVTTAPPKYLPALDMARELEASAHFSPNVNSESPDLSIAWSEDGRGVTISGEKGSNRPSTPTWSARVERNCLEISSLANQICKQMDTIVKDVVRDEEARLIAGSLQTRLTFEDPVLTRAKEVAAKVNKPESTLGVSSEETKSLKKIAAVTKRVNDNLQSLLENSWVAHARAIHDEEERAEAERAELAEQAEDDDEVDEEADARPGSGHSATERRLSKLGIGGFEEVEGLPSLAERLNRVTSDDDEISDSEKQRMYTAFLRFKEAGSADLHKDKLIQLLEYLGHVMTKGEGLWEIYNDVTGYDYLDFDEFLAFVYKFTPYEKEEMKRVFEEFDEDGSGELSIAELRTLTAQLGITPMRAMMKEALDIVDADGNGQLDFEEFSRFLVVYRHCEGFTRPEVAELLKVYNRLLVDDKLPAESLCDGLVRVFGVQMEEAAETLMAELQEGPGETEGLMFGEFLIFARRAREMQQKKIEEEHGAAFSKLEAAAQAEFNDADADRSGGVSKKELYAALKKMEYEPLYVVIDEVFDEVADDRWSVEGELDFNEFFDFITIYRKRDGFTKDQVDELFAVFERFDEAGEEEISALELSDVFRFLGHSPTLEEIHVLVAKVDVNGSNALDFREFLMLMQMYRKKDINKMKHTFQKHARNASLMIKDVLTCLTELDQETSKDTLATLPAEGLQFEPFVLLVDSCRSDWVARQRKKAGYADEEIENFQDSFNKFDRDRSGEIDNLELQKLLTEFGWEPKSKDEQQALLAKFDVARDLAKEAGVTTLSEKGSSEITFYEFVQLARMLQKQHDSEEEMKMKALMAELKYNHGEVDGFRQVFMAASRGEQAEGEDEEDAKAPAKGKRTLTREQVRRLLRGAGAKFSPELSAKLDGKLKELEDAKLELAFDGFLRLMRWVEDVKFIDLSNQDTKTKSF